MGKNLGLPFLGNLIEFEGMNLLSVFGSDRAGYRMALWVDYEENLTLADNWETWVVFSAEKNDILGYIRQELTLLDLIRGANTVGPDRIPYLYLMRINETTGKFTLNPNIPKDYMPSGDSFLADCIRSEAAEHLWD